jgi:hypothetical protein
MSNLLALYLLSLASAIAFGVLSFIGEAGFAVLSGYFCVLFGLLALDELIYLRRRGNGK